MRSGLNVALATLSFAVLLAGCSAPSSSRDGAEPAATSTSVAPPPSTGPWAEANLSAPLDYEPVAFDVARPGQPPLRQPARWLHPMETWPTGGEGGEPTVRSTGSALLVTGGPEVLRSKDGREWSVVQRHERSFDPVLAWDPVLRQAVKADLDASLACALVSTSSADGATWTKQAPACSATLDYLKVAAGPPGPDANPLTGPSVTYLCHNAAPPTNPCLVSDDGAATFRRPSPIVPPSLCGGITSYPAVSPSGVVALPVHGLTCGPAFYVSRDSGLTWTVLEAPDVSPVMTGSMTSADFDGRRLVAAWESAEGVVLAWTDDLESWSGPFVVSVPGAAPRFNAMQAGNGTVALAFLGQTGQDWSTYVVELDAATLEGAAYRLLDPVQRGDICMDGARCTRARNLADFITSTTHAGDFVVAWTDGCVACPAGQQSADQALTVTRLVVGTL